MVELPNGMGGLGIRNVRAYNMALLTKQAVRIHENKNLWISKVINGKYKDSPVSIGIRGRRIPNASWGLE